MIYDTTVTVYHKEGDRITRRVLTGCHLEMGESLTLDKGQANWERDFFLVIPLDRPVAGGDKIWVGIGPKITAEQWQSFIPAQYPQLLVARQVRAYSLGGRIHHYEVSRKRRYLD